MKKWRNIRKLSKVAIVLTTLLIATVVTATLIVYFGEVDTELDIKQSVTIDNKSHNEPINHKVKLQSGDSISFTHKFHNKAKTCDVLINHTTSGLIEGLTLRFYDKHDNLITFPFRLNASSNMRITMTFHADVNLESQKVKITTLFSVSEV